MKIVTLTEVELRELIKEATEIAATKAVAKYIVKLSEPIGSPDDGLSPIEAVEFTGRSKSTIRNRFKDGLLINYGTELRPIYKRSELVKAFKMKVASVSI